MDTNEWTRRNTPVRFCFLTAIPNGACTTRRIASRIAYDEDDYERSNSALLELVSKAKTHTVSNNYLASKGGGAIVIIQAVVVVFSWSGDSFWHIHYVHVRVIKITVWKGALQNVQRCVKTESMKSKFGCKWIIKLVSKAKYPMIMSHSNMLYVLYKLDNVKHLADYTTILPSCASLFTFTSPILEQST